MSELLAPATTIVDKIPLWRRIRELMKEKGSRYSMTAVANRLGISRETLRLMLNGEREIYMFELEKIANDLKLPVARILQQDIEELNAQIKERQESLQDLPVAMELAKQRFAIAQGLSEKANALLDIRFLHTFQEQWPEAEQTSLAAYELIMQIGLAEHEDDLVFRVQSLLVTVYIHSKRYSKGLEVLQSIEKLLKNKQRRMINYYHNKGICHWGLNELEDARRCFNKAIELLQDYGNAEWMGRVFFIMGVTEYADLNYSRAKELLQDSLQHLETDIMRVGSAKDLAKVLLKLGEHQAAENLIRETLQSDAVKQSPEMEARLLILLSKVRGLPYHAEAVAGNGKYGNKMRFLAARFLRVYYRRWFMQGRGKQVKAVCKMPRRSFPYDKYL